MNFSVARFDVSFGTFYLMYEIILSSVNVTEWAPILGKSYSLDYDKILVLTEPVPGHCLLFTFCNLHIKSKNNTLYWSS